MAIVHVIRIQKFTAKSFFGPSKCAGKQPPAAWHGEVALNIFETGIVEVTCISWSRLDDLVICVNEQLCLGISGQRAFGFLTIDIKFHIISVLFNN